MANFFRIVAVLVLLAGCYVAYADFPAVRVGAINIEGYVSKFILSIGLAAVFWALANRAARSRAPSDDSEALGDA